MAISKIVLNTDSGEQVLVDLTGDNVTSESLVVGSTAHGADGEPVQGANPYELEATNTEVNTQKTLITQIAQALEGKAAGGTGKPEQEKTVEITENGTVEIVPDEGYALSKVTANTNVQGSDVADAIVDRTITEIESNASSVGNHAFYYCRKLVKAVFPNAKTVGTNGFRDCTVLETAEFPVVQQLYDSAFRGDKKIVTMDLPKAVSIASYAFYGSGLETLILKSQTVCTLGNVNGIGSTPIASGTGYIYVPAALVDSYKAATNWSTYAAQFRAIEDYPDICGTEV